jgi:hypothetical protein
VNGIVHVVTTLTLVEPAVGVPAVAVEAAVVETEFSLTAVESPLVLTVIVCAAAVFGFVIPSTWTFVEVLPASEQLAPASVIVTVVAAPTPVAVQLENCAGSTIVGEAGTVKPAGKPTMILAPAPSEPALEVVNGTVQFAIALSDVEVAEGVPAVTLVGAVTVIVVPVASVV